jgi:hypothetical protein
MPKHSQINMALTMALASAFGIIFLKPRTFQKTGGMKSWGLMAMSSFQKHFYNS